jgi:hypothetical protein
MFTAISVHTLLDNMSFFLSSPPLVRIVSRRQHFLSIKSEPANLPWKARISLSFALLCIFLSLSLSGPLLHKTTNIYASGWIPREKKTIRILKRTKPETLLPHSHGIKQGEKTKGTYPTPKGQLHSTSWSRTASVASRQRWNCRPRYFLHPTAL